MVSKGKALVKETGEVLDIKETWGTMIMNMIISGENISYDSDHIGDNYYKLSDGCTYIEKELIIGIDEIRDYKLKKLKNNL